MGDAASGAALFVSESCNVCHSPNGDGTFGAGNMLIDPNALQKTTLANLAAYIDANMPTAFGGPTSCQGSCAEDIAAYLETFVSGGNTVEDFGTYTIEVMDTCAADDSTYAGQRFTVFDNDTNLFPGNLWSESDNHIVASPSEFAGLKTAPASDSRFRLSSTSPSSDPSCSGAKTHTGTWVKKIADSYHQHAYGGEFGVYKTYSSLDSIVLEIKVNSDETSIPTFEEIKSNFGAYVTDSQIDDLDDQNVAFAVGLREQGNSTVNVTNGQGFFQINMSKHADKWIRVTIPVESLNYFTEINYNRTAMSYDTAKDTQADVLYMVAETMSDNATGRVIRNYLYNESLWPFSSQNPTPELFKEQNISIKLMEVRYK